MHPAAVAPENKPPAEDVPAPLSIAWRGAGGEVLAGGEVSEACADCIYRQVVELLAARNPRIAELVEVMRAAQRLRDDLGI